MHNFVDLCNCFDFTIQKYIQSLFLQNKNTQKTHVLIN
ncbi:hypothetical protein FORMB_17290 [Formosa sp. Hel1_33_131]|nr:hypothetical protein FORMB_17290 [Formosa sp. Hel1_33_131]